MYNDSYTFYITLLYRSKSSLHSGSRGSVCWPARDVVKSRACVISVTSWKMYVVAVVWRLWLSLEIQWVQVCIWIQFIGTSSPLVVLYQNKMIYLSSNVWYLLVPSDTYHSWMLPELGLHFAETEYIIHYLNCPHVGLNLLNATLKKYLGTYI